MAGVQVSIVAAKNPPGHKHAVIKCAGQRLVMTITSPAVDHDGLAGDWKQVPRAGDRPFIGMAGLVLETAALTCVLAHRDGSSVEADVKRLRAFARNPDHYVTVANYGSLAAGPWHITALKISSDKRRFGSNHVIRAQAAITLTEAVPDPNPKATTKQSHGGAHRPKSYVVKSGDTLPKIAVRFYGDADVWRSIAKANGIKNPKHLKVGTKLKLP